LSNNASADKPDNSSADSEPKFTSPTDDNDDKNDAELLESLVAGETGE